MRSINVDIICIKNGIEASLGWQMRNAIVPAQWCVLYDCLKLVLISQINNSLRDCLSGKLI